MDASRLRLRPNRMDWCLGSSLPLLLVSACILLLQMSVTVMPVSAAQRRSVRALPVRDVRCDCGRSNRSKELVVVPTNEDHCSDVQPKRPRELRGQGQHHYPLGATLRRTGDESQISISWSWKYIPRRKRSKVSEVYIHFTKSNKKDKTTSQACFKVQGIQKQCRQRVKCKAVYSKRRPRRLSMRILYQYTSRSADKRRHSTGSSNVVQSNRKFYVLKTPIKPRSKRKEFKSYRSKGDKRKRGRRGQQTCKKWLPKVALSTEQKRVTVTFDPVNPFANKIELSLLDAKTFQHLYSMFVSKDVNNYTFTNVRSGNYSLALRPLGPDCTGASYIVSNVPIITGKFMDVEGQCVMSCPDDVKDFPNDNPSRARRHDNIESCQKWIPKVTLRAEKGKVIMHYIPINPFATEIEVSLHEDGSNQQIYPAYISKEKTTHSFENVQEGSYQVALRPLGPECKGATYIRSSETVNVAEEDTEPSSTTNLPPICSMWTADFQAFRIKKHGSWNLIEVDVDTPPNLKAEKIEIALEEDDPAAEHGGEIIEQKFIKVEPRNRTVMFNVSMESDKIYKALVRPCGCRDCPDFTIHGNECLSSYSSAVIGLKLLGSNPPMMNSDPVSRSGNTTASYRVTESSTRTVTTITASAMDPSPLTGRTPEDKAPKMTQWFNKYTLVIIVSSVAIVVVVVAVLSLIGKCCRPKRRQPDAEEGAPEIQRLQPPDANEDIANNHREPDSADNYLNVANCSQGPHGAETDNNFIQNYEEQHNTKPKDFVQSCHQSHTNVDNTERKKIVQPPHQSQTYVVFIVYQKERQNDTFLMKHLADIIRSLSHVRMLVKLDHECQDENRKDVIAWTNQNLKICTKVVVVLSPNFLRICESYEHSRSQQVSSCCAYRDIAPEVMKSLVAEDFSRAVFVHLGFKHAEQDCHQLLELYRNPCNSLRGKLSPVIESGEPSSIPAQNMSSRNDRGAAAVGISNFRHSDSDQFCRPRRCFPCGGDPRPQPFSPNCMPHFVIEGAPDPQPPSYSTIDANVAHDQQCNNLLECGYGGNAACLCQASEASRQRFPSAPQQADINVDGTNQTQRIRHKSEPVHPRFMCSTYNQTLPEPPPYHRECPSSPTSPSGLHYRPGDPISNNNFDISCSSVDSHHPSSHCQSSSSARLSAAVPAYTSATSHEQRAFGETPVGAGPRPIPISTPQGLKRFLSQFCPDEQMIDKTVAGEAAQSFFFALDRQSYDQNPRIPEENSCNSSLAGSRTNVATENSDTDTHCINNQPSSGDSVFG